MDDLNLSRKERTLNMGRPRKYPIEANNRDPIATVRDPVIATRTNVEEPSVTATSSRNPRRYIAASMPTICPDCGGNTRQDDGRHVDPVRAKILEYRTCAHCGLQLAAGREMTEREKERLCTRKEAVAEYEKTVRISD